MADGTTLTNTAVVDSDEDDPAPGNNSATEETEVVTEADLPITKSDSPDPVVAGTDLTYTITVDSAGPSDALGVSVSDVLPAGTSFVSASAGGSYDAGTNTVTWDLGTVKEVDSPRELTLVVSVNPGRTLDLSNTASVSSDTTDPTAGNDSATEETEVDTAADLSITKSDSPDPVVAGTDLTYTITVDSAGPSDALGVSVSDAVPAGTSFVSASDGGTLAAGTVTWNLGTVAEADGPRVLTLVVKVNPSRTANLSNTASVSSTTTDPTAGNNSATEATEVVTAADLSITKSDSPDPVVAGNNLTYTITVDSAGPSDALGVSVSDVLPAGTSFVSASAGGSHDAGTNTVTWELGTVAAADAADVLTLVVKVASSVADNTSLSNTAEVSSDTTDPTPGNNSATEATHVDRSADLADLKVATPEPVRAGESLFYTVTVTNSGPSDADNVSLVDTLPAGVSNARYCVVVLPAEPCTVDDSTHFSPYTSGDALGLGTLVSGQSKVVKLTVDVDSDVADGTTLTNTAVVDSDEDDPAPGNNSATEETEVVTEADLSITKSDSPDPVVAGTDLTYTITVDSAGPSDALGVSVSDVLPAGTSFVSASAGGSYDAGTNTVTWDLGTVKEADAPRELTLVVSVNPGRTLDLSNTASVSSDTTDPTAGNDSATEETEVDTAADLSITKSDSPDPVVAGTDLTYTITVDSAGPSDALGVSVSDAVPAGTSFVSASDGGTLAAGTVTWNLGTVAEADGPRVLTLVVKVNPSRTANLSNTASVSSTTTDPTAGNNSATEATEVVTAADLSITKSDSPDPVVAGNNLTYTITVDSAGPSDALGVSVSDVLPAGTSFVSASAGGSHDAGTNTVTWELGTVAAADAADVLTLVVKVASSVADNTSLSNTAEVSSDTTDPTPGNNSATEATHVDRSADLADLKVATPEPVRAGESLFYTVTVTNSGPSDADNVSLVDTLPAGVSNARYCVVVLPAEPCTVDDSTHFSPYTSGDALGLGTLVSGQSKVVKLTVDVDPDVADGTTLTNTAVVDSDEDDPAPGNNSATEETEVVTEADLSITKSDSPDPVVAGTDLTYTITVDSAGPSDALGVSVSDVLPAGTSFVSASAGGSYDAGTNTVTWDLGTVKEADAPRELTLVVSVNPGRTLDLSNTASVSSDTTDPTAGNDSATEETEVDTAADLSITKSDSPDPVVAGTDLTYTITVDSAGPSDALGVSVSDAVPAGTSFVSASDGGTLAAGTVTWNLGTVAEADGPRVLTLVVKVNPSRTANLSNTASVSSTTTDPTAGNNSATEATEVVTAADLSITKSDSPDPVVAGNNLTYTITVDSAGPSDALGVSVSDVLPAGTSFVSASAGGSHDAGTNTVTWELGTVAAADAADVLTLVVKVASSVADNTSLSNTAEVSSDTTDPTPGNNSATEATHVDRSADLADLKVATPEPVRAGESLFYTVTVTNSGPSDADNVSLVDTLPAGVSNARYCVVVLPAEPCTVDDSTHFSPYTSGDALGLGTLVSGQSKVVKLTVDVDPDVADGTTLTNTAVVDSDEDDPAPGNNSATEETEVVTEADLSITKSDSPDPVVAGTDLTYTITVDSAGPSDALGVSVSDVLPAGTSFVSASAGGSYDAGTNTVTWDLGTVKEADAPRELTLVVSVNPGRTLDLSNTASVSSDTTDPTAGNDSATEETEVDTAADLSITKSDSPDPVVAGTDLTYTITVDSAGPSDALGVSVSDAVPAGTSFVSASDGGTLAAGTVTWNLGTVAEADGPRVLTLVVKVNPSRTANLSNTASVSSTTTDPTAGNNSATEATEVVTAADLSITKSDSPDPVVAGNNLTYTITVDSAGPSDALGVSVSDVLPAGTSFVSASAGGSHDAGTNTVTWELGTVAAADAADVLTLVVKVASSVADNTSLSNTAEVSSDTTDPTPGNNSATEATVVNTAADLSITKTDGVVTAVSGQSTSYTITVTNQGPSDASSVEAWDTLPSQLTAVSYCVMDACAESDYLPYVSGFHINLGNLAAGQSTVIKIRGTYTYPLDAGTTVTNKVDVSSSTTDPTPGNNSATDSNTVVAATVASTSIMTDSAFQLKDDLGPWTISDFEILMNNKNTVVATNPGQFYYHQRAVNTFPAPVSMRFDVSWPCTFAPQTVGGQPLHMYVQLAGDAPNTWRDWASNSSSPTWSTTSCASTGTGPVGTGSMTARNVPVGAKVWITVHLDYALKDTTQSSTFTSKPIAYGPFSSVISIRDQASGFVVGASSSSESLLGRGKKVTVVYGDTVNMLGAVAPNTWIRLSQGGNAVTLRTDVAGGYVLYDGQECPFGAICTGGWSSLVTFQSGNNVATTLTVLGDGATPSAAAAFPAPWTKMEIRQNGSVLTTTTSPTHSMAVTKGNAYNRDLKFKS